MLTVDSFMVAMVVGSIFLVISTTVIAVGLNVLWKEVYKLHQKLATLRTEINAISFMVEEMKNGNERIDDSN